MSDWSVYEIEDIAWDELDKSDDHIVPHPRCTTSTNRVQGGDCPIKARGEEVTVLGGSTESKTSVMKNVLQGKETNDFHQFLDERKAQMLEKGSWSTVDDNVFPASCNSDCVSLPTALAPDDAKIPSNCLINNNLDSLGSEFCVDDPILGDGTAAVDNNLCNFQLDDISAAENNLEFFGNRHETKESGDLLDYGWPDIGNFEDVDRMFRNCDSTFGQGNAGNVNDLSWFSTSSDTNECSEDKSSIKSSCVERGVLKSASEHREPEKKVMPASDSLPLTDCDKKRSSDTSNKSSWNSDSNGYCTYADWYDADTKSNGEFASIDQAQEDNGSDEIKISPRTPKSNESSVTGSQSTELQNGQSKQSKSQDRPKGKRKVKSSAYINGNIHSSGPVHQFSDLKLPSSVPSSSQAFAQQRQFWGGNSYRHLHGYSLYGQQPCKHPSQQFPVSPTVSSIKSETVNNTLSCEVPSHTSNNVSPLEIPPNPSPRLSAVIPGEKANMRHSPRQLQTGVSNMHHHDQFMSHSTVTDQATVQKQVQQNHDEVAGDSEVEETGMEFAVAEAESNVQESSCMSSVLSNEVSLEASSFRQLQDVMEQLDVRTKLCIRDSLYRLARSAEQRHKLNGSNRDKRGSGTSATEESSKCLGYMDPETDTNPIDRSIAHLLFYRPSGPALRPSNDAMSLESQVHGSKTNLPAMHDQLICQEDIAGGTDMKLPITSSSLLI